MYSKTSEHSLCKTKWTGNHKTQFIFSISQLTYNKSATLEETRPFCQTQDKDTKADVTTLSDQSQKIGDKKHYKLSSHLVMANVSINSRSTGRQLYGP